MNLIKQLNGLLASALLRNAGFAASPEVPKTWDDAEMRTIELPLADPAVTRAYAPADYYYRIPGHEFGLDLSAEDRKALIAYLKTL